MKLKLRNWQQEALQKALHWLLIERQDRHFLINAAPGAGKTLASCAIALQLLEQDEIDRIVVIAPRAEVVSQWADDARRVTGRFMGKVTGADDDIAGMGMDICATWSAIQGLLPELQTVCRTARTLVICDEHHHAAVKAAWGLGADGAFADAQYVLVLTGTPIRSDGAESVWLAYDDAGAIDHPEAGSYTLSYGDAIDLGYCRPVTFHRHEGRFTVDLRDNQQIQICSSQPAQLNREQKRIPGLQTALDFYRLACTPQYDRDGHTPLASGYQATMMEWGSQKLNELRNRMPSAGGLIIAPNIKMAEYFVELIEMIEGDRPILVHSQLSNPGQKIKAFRNSNKRWLVSVNMVSEGVDIPRLRVLVYLPNALTELAFRQAIGRAVRTLGPDDDTRAYVIMPSFQILEEFGRRVEDEMSPAARIDSTVRTSKRCAACGGECALGTRACPTCGYEFPQAPERTKSCEDCDAVNPMTARACHACGADFSANFELTLDEALRTGAIVRGMDIDEGEVQQAEAMADIVRERVLRSGDQRLVHIIQTLPDESYARLRSILDT